ncbi:hypothetical protein HAX54_039507, partial [Datura stramonium]|nr:hypothetical protein [Datura stramonium]
MADIISRPTRGHRSQRRYQPMFHPNLGVISGAGRQVQGKRGTHRYGIPRNMCRECPLARQGDRRGCAQSTSSVAAPAAHPSQQGVSTSAAGGQCQNKLYALSFVGSR